MSDIRESAPSEITPPEGKGRSTGDRPTVTAEPSLRPEVIDAYQQSHQVFAPLYRELAA
jgi:hypothetical protein